jgi:hypothetical protein
MPGNHLLTLRQIDQARGDLYGIADEIEALKSDRQSTEPVLCEPGRVDGDRHDLGADGCHRLDRRDMTPGTEHYREIADLLRAAARACQFAGARREILLLAARLESRAAHLDRRARSISDHLPAQDLRRTGE